MQYALDAVAAAGMVGVDMRYFAAQDRPPARVCQQIVRDCDVFVAVIGFRYGTLAPDLDVSYTELEFDTATEVGLPRIVVLLRYPPGDAPMVDIDRTRVERFRRRLADESGLAVSFVDVPAEVKFAVHHALTALRRGVESPQVVGPGWMWAGPEGAEGVRGHIARRGRGQRSVARGGDLFRGRAEALKVVGAWLERGEPPGRVLVVTGQPGAGKSAVVARAALDLEPAAVSGRHTLGVVFHARAATVIELLAAVAAVTGTGVAESVFGMVERVAQAVAPPGGWWRVVVDALDEAATDADRDRMVEAVRELAGLATVRVVVATRALSASPGTAGRFAPGALLPALGVLSAGEANLVDLDTDQFFDPAGLVAFSQAVLCQDGAARPAPPGGAWVWYRRDAGLCQRLADVIASRAGRNYLVAALTADPLSQADSVIDPAADGFRATDLPSNVGEALAKYLDRQPEQRRVRIRMMLTALAYARGSGISDDLWAAIAAALGHPVTMAELDVLRTGRAADYLLQSATVDGAPVTRLFHQALADELLATRPRRHDETRLLGCLIPAPPATWSDASGYARTHGAEHAAAGQQLTALLGDPVYPTVAELTRLLSVLPPNPDVGLGPVVAVLRTAGARAYALTPPRRANLFALTAVKGA